MLGTYLIGAVLILIIWQSIVTFRLKRVINRIPGPRLIFPFGNSILPMTSKFEDLDYISKKIFERYRHNPISRYWAFHYPVIIVLKASAAEILLRSTHDLTKNRAYTVLDSWLGKGLLTSTSQKWTQDRKMLTPSFHFQILNTFMDIFNEKSLIFVNKLNKLSINEEPFDLFSYITLCTLDTICDAAMGKNIDAQNQHDTDYVRAVIEMSEIVAKRICYPWLMIPWIYSLTVLRRKEKQCLKILHNFTNKVISERKADRKTQKVPNLDQQKQDDENLGVKTRLRFLDMLLEVSERDENLTDLEIREQVDTFMFEGHDTTACSLSWTLYFIGRYPEVQEKIQMELNDIFMENKCRAITSSDLSQMKYLEAVIKESMRMVPVIPMFGRKLEKDTEIDGYKIPAGIDIMVNSYFIHHDPDIYDKPEVFDPNRFVNENKAGRHPYGFLGFSAGSRNCIGQKFALMEEKVILAHLLLRYKITSLEAFEDMKISRSLVAKPLNGLHVTLKQRSDFAQS